MTGLSRINDWEIGLLAMTKLGEPGIEYKDKLLLQKLLDLYSWHHLNSRMPKPKTPTMRSIAGFIERNCQDDLVAVLKDSYTRGKKSKGKLRSGVKITVTDAITGCVVWEHDTLDSIGHAVDTTVDRLLRRVQGSPPPSRRERITDETKPTGNQLVRVLRGR